MPKLPISSALLLVLLHCGIAAKAQRIDYALTPRAIDRESYFRFHYDNDYFTKTDRYYSQGISLEYANSRLKNFPLTKLLIHQRSRPSQYGIVFNIFGFTPTSIEDNTILYGDRPFAAAVSLTTFASSTDSQKRQRISSSLSLGMIGPAAQGEEIQTNIHRWLKNKIPIGWEFQIRNDVIVNYQFSYEKSLLSGRSFLVNTIAEARLGTLNNLLSGGFNFMTGHFNDPYQNSQSAKKKVQYYFFGQARAALVGYDATLQGGLFNRSSPYTIPSSDISRLSFRADAGLILNFRNVFFSYTQSYLSKEFSTGVYHRWGGVSMGLSL